MVGISAKTISHVQGKGSLTHNNRDFHYKNVDPERTKDNTAYARQTLPDAYAECFGDSLERYNAQQKRADRRIDDYYAKLFGASPQTTVATAANKEKSFYETVVGIGNMLNTGVGTVDGDLAAKCLDEYMRGFRERNPNFHVFNAVLHMDEATPHLHINYVPVGHYKSGKVMDTRNSISQALKEMGHGGGKDAINRWRISERAVLKNICAEHGIEIAEEQKGRGHTLTPEEYKAQIEAEKAQLKQATQEEIEAEKMQMQQAVQEEINVEKSKLQSELDAEKISIEGKIAGAKTITRALENMKESGLGKVKSTTFKGVTVEEATKILKAASDRDKARDKEKKAVAKCEEAIAKCDAAIVAQKAAEEKLVGVEEREAAADEKMKEAKALYFWQHEINRHLEQAETDRDYYKDKRDKAESNVTELTKSLEEKAKTVKTQVGYINYYKSELNLAYQDIANIIKAISMLNTANNEGYAVPNLSPQCNRLISGISNFAATRTREAAARSKTNHFGALEYHLKEYAESIDKKFGINSEIARYIAALEARSMQNNRGASR